MKTLRKKPLKDYLKYLTRHEKVSVRAIGYSSQAMLTVTILYVPAMLAVITNNTMVGAIAFVSIVVLLLFIGDAVTVRYYDKD